MDGLLRRRDGGVLERLLHVGDAPARVRVAQGAGGVLAFAATAERRDVAEEAVQRMRFATGADDDLRPFHEEFRSDPLIGASVRARPHLRVPRRPEPFEVLCWAVCEQLIEYRRAVEIERGIVGRLGRRCADSGLRDLPSAATLAAVAPAELERLGLSAGRSLALRRAAAEVASGRVDLRAADHERGWARLRAIPGIGQWTLDVLALHGQGRYDRLPAGDLAYLRFAGRLLRGHPRARATEEEVRELFAPYGRWAGLAGAHALGAPVGQGSLRATAPVSFRSGPTPRPRAPHPAGTRSSRPSRRRPTG
jgi:3-methyladenine DNA glycosylase/8-oxoguanine DNA glycosylase